MQDLRPVGVNDSLSTIEWVDVELFGDGTCSGVIAEVGGRVDGDGAGIVLTVADRDAGWQ